MYNGFTLTPPFFEIGLKAYLYGREALRLALHADEVSQKYGVQVIVTPQYVDIPLLAHELKHAAVFAQHMDSLEPGRGIGSVLPEALKAAGAAGVLLNHAEKPLSREELERALRRADAIGLATMVCADTLADAVDVARMEPNIIIAESPALIGGGQRSAEDRRAIAEINEAVWKINASIRVLHGAGIHSGRDVYDIIAAGSHAAGSTSGILLAKDPFAMLEEMIHAVREAWDDTH